MKLKRLMILPLLVLAAFFPDFRSLPPRRHPWFQKINVSKSIFLESNAPMNLAGVHLLEPSFKVRDGRLCKN